MNILRSASSWFGSSQPRASAASIKHEAEEDGVEEARDSNADADSVAAEIEDQHTLAKSQIEDVMDLDWNQNGNGLEGRGEDGLPVEDERVDTSTKKGRKSKKERKNAQKSQQLAQEDTEEGAENETVAIEEVKPSKKARKPRARKSHDSAVYDIPAEESDHEHESAVRESKPTKKSRKSNGVAKARKSNGLTRSRRKSSEGSPAEPEQHDSHAEDTHTQYSPELVSMVNEPGLARLKEEKVKTKKPRRSRKLAADEDTLMSGVQDESIAQPPGEIITDDFAALPAKIKKLMEGLGSQHVLKEIIIPEESTELPVKKKRAKKKSSTKLPLEVSAFADHQDSASPEQQAPHVSIGERQPEASTHDDDLDLEIRRSVGMLAPVDLEEEVQEEVKRPSKKALGKRKASNSLDTKSKKKRKNLEPHTVGNADLRNLGFTLQNHQTPSRRSSSQLDHELVHTARTLYAADAENESRLPTPAPILPLSQTLISKSTPMVLIHTRQPSIQPRGGTPKFTPINSRSVLARIPTTNSTGPWQPSPLPLQRPRKAEDNLSENDSESPQPEPAEQPPPQSPVAPESDDASEYEPVALVPKSSERRKRRLPDVESSSPVSRINGKMPFSKVTDPKTPKPKANSQQPKATPGSKLGKFVQDEVDAIRSAVEKYREQNGMSQREINAVVHNDAKASKELWNSLCEDVPDVPRKRIQQFCRRTFHNFEARGSWTEEQDEDLRLAHATLSGSWSKIGKALNRFPEDCRDRWRNYLVCGNNMRKDKWDKEEEEQLRAVVTECMDAISELKLVSKDPRYIGRDEESLVDWNIVSDKMGHIRSRLQCLAKWKQIKDRQASELDDPIAAEPVASAQWRVQQAETQAHTMVPTEILEFLYAVRDSGAGREGKIPWNQVQVALDVKGRRMALKVCLRRLKDHIPNHENMKLQEVVQFLIDEYELASPNEPELFRSSLQPSQKSKNQKKPRPSNQRENREGPSSTRKRPRKQKEGADQEAIEESNGEGPSTKKSRSSRSKNTRSMEEQEQYAAATPSIKKKSSKKIRDRMMPVDQSQSQETNQSQNLDSDSTNSVAAALEALRSKKPKRGRDLKSKRLLSDYRVIESDDEQEADQIRSSEQPNQEIEGSAEGNEHLNGPYDQYEDNPDLELAQSSLIDEIPPNIQSDEEEDSSSNHSSRPENSEEPQEQMPQLDDNLREDDESTHSQSEQRSPPPQFHRAGSQRNDSQRNFPAQYEDRTDTGRQASSESDDNEDSHDEENPEIQVKDESDFDQEPLRYHSSESSSEEDEQDASNEHGSKVLYDSESRSSDSSDEEKIEQNGEFHNKPSPDLDDTEDANKFHHEASPISGERHTATLNGFYDGDDEVDHDNIGESRPDYHTSRSESLPKSIGHAIRTRKSPVNIKGYKSVNIETEFSSDDSDEDIPPVAKPRPQQQRELLSPEEQYDEKPYGEQQERGGSEEL